MPGVAPHPGKSPPFVFAAVHIEHAHLYDQCRGLLAAGATLKWVFEPEAARRARFCAAFPDTRVARSLDEILDDPAIALVVTAAVPSERAALGRQVMRAGKDYFTDKPPFTTLEQLVAARQLIAATGRKHLVYFSERLHLGAVIEATRLIADGAIGRVVQVTALGPHRLGSGTRPEWFFDPAHSGGILCDLSSHQIEQFLTWTNSTDARIVHAAVATHAHRDRLPFEDFGEVSLETAHGSRAFIRVDWLTTAGLRTWGDGRSLILGTKGYLELRKYIDLARSQTGNHLYLVNDEGEFHFECADPDFAQAFAPLIDDCQQRTDLVLPQEHVLKTCELALLAQARAQRLAAAAQSR